MIKYRLPIFCFLSLALTCTACLKTRAQIREDGGAAESAAPTESGNAVPAQIQDVQPQGQYVIDEIKGEMTRLMGRIEDLERSQKQSQDPSRAADFKKLETRVNELEQAQSQMLEAIKKLQDTSAAPDSAELFERGKNQIESENYEAAVDSFTNYLKVPKAKHQEEATFLRGEAHFHLKNYKKAIVDYSKFTEKYTKSKHAPVALLKIAQSFEALGMTDDAKGFYQELADKFPKSTEGKKARAKLR